MGQGFNDQDDSQGMAHIKNQNDVAAEDGHKADAAPDDIEYDRPLVVIVMGSPRPEGNCAALALDAYNRCGEAGCEPVIVSSAMLMQEYAKPCNGCMNCLATGQCILGDGVDEFYEMIDQSSGLMWVTPTYFASVPGQLKSLIDRFQFFWSRKQRGDVLTFEERRPATAIIVGTGDDPFGTDAVLAPLTSASNIAQFTLVNPAILMGIDKPGAILSQEHAGKRLDAIVAIDAFIDGVLKWHG
jgi:multimeric flavodoxin WrbA